MQYVPVARTPVAPQPLHNGGGWRTAWLSVALHGAALAVAFGLISPHVLPVPPSPPSFALVVLPAPPVEQPLPARIVPRAEATTTTSLMSPPSISLQAAQHAEIHIAHTTPRPKASMPTTPAQIAPPVAAPPPPPSHAVSQDVLAGLESRIRQAVQNAAIYPPSARLMHREGRAQVRFDYTDGTAASAALAASSQSAILDSAALAAVRRAALPRAPVEIGHRTLALLVWVEFTLTNQN